MYVRVVHKGPERAFSQTGTLGGPGAVRGGLPVAGSRGEIEGTTPGLLNPSTFGTGVTFHQCL